MKAIPTSVKAQFFAMYLGQKVFKLLGLEHIYDRPMEKIYDEDYLELRHVSDLTDEEKFCMAELVCARHNRHYKKNEVEYHISPKREFDIEVLVKGHRRYMVQLDTDGVGFVDYFMGGAGRIHHYAPGQFAVTDYLRSIGILISFTYLNEDKKPVTLSVDELIGMKWVIVKQINK